MPLQSGITGYLGNSYDPRAAEYLQVTREKQLNWLPDLLVFIIPTLRFLDVHMVGRLLASELVILALFPIVLSSGGRRLLDPVPRMFIFLALLWLMGQIVSDVILDTPYQDYIRGWAKITIFLLNFSVLYILIGRNIRRIWIFTGGLIIGGFASYLVGQESLAEIDPWKFGYGFPITLIAILIASRLGKKGKWRHNASLIVILFVAIVNFYMGSRALGGVCSLTAIFLFFHRLMIQRRPRTNKTSFKKRLIMILLTGMAGWGIIQVYEHAASAGWLGEDAELKYEMQAFGDYGLLIGGRSEILISTQAIMDSPILGHGSWAKDYKYADAYIELKRELGYVVGSSEDEGYIPSHSHLFGAWVEAGVLGGVFWMWILVLAVRLLIKQLNGLPMSLTPLVVFLTITLVWHVLFSPFGFQMRLMMPFYIVVIMLCLPRQTGLMHRIRYK